MGIFIKPDKKYQVGYLPYTPEMMKLVAWCLDNKIEVSLRYSGSPKEFCVEVKIKGTLYKDPKNRKYTDKEALKQMYEYYKYYYEKYNK